MGYRGIAPEDGRGRAAGRTPLGGVSTPGSQGGGIDWPDWRGEIVAIIASGPSAKKADIGALRGVAKVIAIKENIELCPWADAVYGCDRAWWLHRRGLPDFKGLKITWRGSNPDWEDVRTVEIVKDGRGGYAAGMFLDRPDVIGGGGLGKGGNSGFQSLNLALNWGARRILLVGFDMDQSSGVHWYGRNSWAMANNPDDSLFDRWAKAFDHALPQIECLGADVVNTSPNSRIRAFRKCGIEQALRDLA